MFGPSSTLGEVLDDPIGLIVLTRHLPGFAASPTVAAYRTIRLGNIVANSPTLADAAAREMLWQELSQLEGGGSGPAPYLPAHLPDPGYESVDVVRASARLILPGAVPQWEVLEVRFDGPSHGNPFVDVELDAVFIRPDGSTVRVGGFHDGDGEYAVRLLGDAQGEWSFVTRSTARSLDGLSGVVTVTAPREGRHGPVRVDGFHFRYADGTRYRPLGTTAYAWTHQRDELQEQTLRTLAEAPFAKIRMCLFPKSYLFNANEPADFVFPGSLEDGFDLERFDPAHFRRLERRIAQLGDLGIQADLILFHPYDRWGFADLGPAVDARYLRYVVRRLAAFSNVWWSMANEYDLLWSKTGDDWERLAAIVGDEDPFGHLNSIHNCRPFYDYSRPWITHVSIQRVDVYRTAENTDEWRERWGKPVVIDECAYEGDIDQGWGNITGEEMVRRFWEGAVRGGYVGHGETYLPGPGDDEVLWWAKGGALQGTSADRVGFLERLLSEAPEGVWNPLASDWDVPWGGTESHRVGYFGFNRPRFHNVVLPDGAWTVDVIDTWDMTVDRLDDTYRATVRVPLPGRPFMAVRVIRVAD